MIFNFDDDRKPPTPVDNTTITSTLLYYSEEELREFKTLCKAGMLAMYGDKRTEANASDFLLHLLRQQYGKTNITK